MNLGEVLNSLQTTVDRDDLTPLYRDVVRDAALQIQKEHSWRWMRTRFDIASFTGDTVAQLPANFKELVGERESLRQDLGGGVLVPWTIYAEPQGSRLNAVAWSSRQIATLDYEVGFPVLRFPIALAANANFRIFYYQYLTDLVSDDQVNVLTVRHAQLLLNKARAIAYELVNDPQYEKYEALYELYKSRDVASDMQADLSGRTRVPKDIVQLARKQLFQGAKGPSAALNAQSGGDNTT